MSRQEVQRKFDEIVSFAEIEKFVDTPVKRYSSGMYVRLAFAVAAHLESEILLVDEVLAVGDVEFQKKCLGKMGDVATNEGRTVLFVSHNMAAMKFLCRVGLVLKQGSRFFEGNISDAVDNYLTQYEKSNLEKNSNIIREIKSEIWIKEIFLENLDGNIIDAVSVGQTFDIVIEYGSTKAINLKNLNFGIDVFNHLDQRVFVQSMKYSGFSSDLFIGSTGSVCCRLFNLPLPKGHYRIAVNIKLDNNRVDFLESAYQLTINDDGFFNSTVSLNSKDVLCLVKGEWRVKK